MLAVEGLAIVFVTAAGLGVWFPVKSVGGRLFLGSAAIPVLMNLIHFTTRAPLSWVAPVVAALAVPGLYRILRSALRAGNGAGADRWRAALLNPAVVLPVVAGVVMAVRGLDTYSIYSWDEFASWMYWPREAFAADSFFAHGMNWQLVVYTQGWPMALLYPQLFFDRFEAVRSVPVGLLWHAGLLGLMFDAIRAHLRRAVPRIGKPPETLGAWLVVLVLLSAQATWTLLPQLLLIEPPQIFMVAGAFAFLLLGLGGTEDRNRCVAGAGLMLAAGYLTKVTALGAVPAAALAVLMMPGPGRSPATDGPAMSGADWRGAAIRLFYLLAPVVAIYVWWSLIRPIHGPSCFSDPFSLPSGSGTSAADQLLAMGERVTAGVSHYFATYKFPLTVVAGVGLLLAFSRRALAPVSAGIILYALVYGLSLVPLYAWCYGGATGPGDLDSLQRYIRVPLRIVHLFGPVLLFIAAAELARVRSENRLGRLLSTQTAIAALAGATVAAAILQIHDIDLTVRNVRDRVLEPPESVATINEIEGETQRLLELIRRAGLKSPEVTLIAQGKSGFELCIARYLRIDDRRGGNRLRYRIDNEFSWSPAPRNQWMHRQSAAGLAAFFKSRDIIWPMYTDDWIRGVLAPLVPDGQCSTTPESYFLVRTPDGPSAFRCVAKKDLADGRDGDQ